MYGGRWPIFCLSSECLVAVFVAVAIDVTSICAPSEFGSVAHESSLVIILLTVLSSVGTNVVASVVSLLSEAIPAAARAATELTLVFLNQVNSRSEPKFAASSLSSPRLAVRKFVSFLSVAPSPLRVTTVVVPPASPAEKALAAMPLPPALPSF